MALAPGSTAIVSTQTDSLHLRGQPNMSGAILGELPRHSTVRIDGPQDGAFYPVTCPGVGPGSGYAAAAYLTAAPVDVPAPVVPPFVDVVPPPPDPVAGDPSLGDPAPPKRSRVPLFIAGGVALAAAAFVMTTKHPALAPAGRRRR